VSGGLAAGGFSLSPETLLNLLLVWLLADPLLGVIWDLGAGSALAPAGRGIWGRLLQPDLPQVAAPVLRLPYTQAGSPGYRLAQRLGQARRWWRETLRPEAGTETASLAAALVLALLLGAVLGRSVLALIAISIAFSWLCALAEKREPGATHFGKWVAPKIGDAPGAAADKSGPAVWRALGEFTIPWLMGASVMGRVSGTVILLALCYTVAYFGLIRPARGFGLAAAGQATAAVLLAGLRYPLAAGAAAILLLPQWGLRTLEQLGRQPPWPAWRSQGGQGSPPQSDAVGSPTAAYYAQPFIILSMGLAALAIAP
jgi:hypothetical protein